MGFATEIEQDYQNLSKYTTTQLHKLYDRCVLELVFYGRHVPGMNDRLDRKYEKQEAQLLQLQEDILDYLSYRPILTFEDAEALVELWNDIVMSGAGECLQMANQLAKNLMSFYQSRARA